MSKQPYYLLQPRPQPNLLSVVVTTYNEQEVLPFLRQRLSDFLDNLTCSSEVILVNDGSSDASLPLMVAWAQADPRVRVLNLARNFGHQAAATAGLDHAKGDAVVLIDADLQDPPEVILSMLAEYQKGYDVVYGQRISRAGETAFKRFTAWAFYRLMRSLVHKDLPADVGDFRLVSRPCLEALLSMRETHRFLRGMVAWVGFPQAFVPYARDSRVAGVTKYPLHKMLQFAWTAAVSFSPTPLRLSFGLGLLIAGVGMFEAINAIVRTFLGLYVVPGWTSLLVVNCLIGGAILVSIGVLGEYVGRIFEASKERPIYIVASHFAQPQPTSIPSQLAELNSQIRSVSTLSQAHHD